MCCLFGMIDYGDRLTGKQKTKVLSVLSKECEERGTDATGIAYHERGKLRIYKRPLAAHQMRFRIPDDVSVVMGHTRMTTQGSASRNRNNHPFPGRIPGASFALAHNGVLYNDLELRQTWKLPCTKIETDSYAAVQLIEKKRALTFDSLKFMAEEVEGSFCFTVLDHQDGMYFVKGDNPLCIYHYPWMGLYLYASTEAILTRALKKMKFSFGKAERVELDWGDILRIDSQGQESRSEFFPDQFLSPWHLPEVFYAPRKHAEDDEEAAYIDELKTAARYCGYDERVIDIWLRDGFTTDEIEEFLYCGEI